MSFKDLAGRVVKNMFKDMGEYKEGMSPTEREVLYFRKQEREDNLKKELAHYRKKNTEEVLFGSSLLKNKKSILKKPNCFNGKNKLNQKQKSILG